MARERKAKTEGKPLVIGIWEYWFLGSEVYRVAVGNRAYILPEGIPANARWECSRVHFERFIQQAVRP
jgi:hypothetical protein